MVCLSDLCMFVWSDKFLLPLFAFFSILGRLWRGRAVFSESNWNLKTWTKVCNLSEVCLAFFSIKRVEHVVYYLWSLILFGKCYYSAVVQLVKHVIKVRYSQQGVFFFFFFSSDGLWEFSLQHRIILGDEGLNRKEHCWNITWSFMLHPELLFTSVWYAACILLKCNRWLEVSVSR